MDHNTNPRNENVQVLVRCRPPNEREINQNQPIIVRCCEKQKQVTVQSKNNKLYTKTFCFDSVFDSHTTQNGLFVSSIKPIIEEVLNGYNCTIFVYGTTGTGKTYTMEGPSNFTENLSDSALPHPMTQNEIGIISRSVDQIFSVLEKDKTDYNVRVSHLELYNEDLFDLINPHKVLKITEDPKSGVHVSNLEELTVLSPQSIFKILRTSWEVRKMAETDLNKHSSRSHCIFSITIYIKEPTDDGEDSIKIGKLNFVDLAGSENINRSGSDRDFLRKQEAGNINKSLLTLGRVITALAENASHVPYRESKLTRLLRDSLGGRMKTCIIATISPCSKNLDETISTLEYASRAKHIKNRPELNQRVSKREAMTSLTKENTRLRSQLQASYEKNGVSLDVHLEVVARLSECEHRVSETLRKLEESEKHTADLQERYDDQCDENNRIKKMLDDTRDVLSDKENQLHSIQTRLSSCEDMIKELSSLRDLLHSQLTESLTILDYCANDVKHLHCKIDSKTEIDKRNNKLIRHLLKDMTARLDNTKACTDSFQCEMKKNLEIFQHSTDELANQEDMKVADLKLQVERLKDCVCQRLNLLSSIVSRNGQALSELVLEFNDSSIQFCDVIRSEIEKGQECAVAKMESLAGDTREFVQRVQTDLSSCAEDVVKSRNGVENFASSQTNAFDIMNQQVSNFSSRQKDTLLHQVDMVHNFQGNQRNAMGQFRSHIVSLVSEALDKYQQDQQKELENLCQMAKEVDIDAPDHFRKEFNESVAHRKVHVNSFCKDQTDLSVQLTDSIKKNVDAVVDSEQRLSSHVTDVKDMLDTQKCVLNNEITGQTRQISEVCKNGTESIRLHVANCSSTIQDTSAETTQMQAGLVTDLSNRDYLNLHLKTVGPLIIRNGAITGNLTQTQCNDSVMVHTLLDEFRLESYNQTGLTPSKKIIPLLQRLSKEGPQEAEAVLKELHHDRTAGSVAPQEVGLPSSTDQCVSDQPAPTTTSQASFSVLACDVLPIEPRSKKGACPRAPRNNPTSPSLISSDQPRKKHNSIKHSSLKDITNHL